MSNFQRSHQDRFYIRPIKFACVLSTLGLMLATPAPAQNEMMRGGGQMDRGNGGGIGTGEAIGLGVGIGGAIIQEMNKPRPGPARDAQNPEPRKAKRAGNGENARDRKLSKGSKPTNLEPDQVKFVGKPENVLHNPNHRVGKLGDLRDHKQVVIQKDDHYFKRHYYYTRLGGRPNWYWYDEPVPDKDRLTSILKGAPICKEDGDDCDEPPPIINVENPPGTPATPAAPPEQPVTPSTVLSRANICLANTGTQRGDAVEVDCAGIKGNIYVRTGIEPQLPTAGLTPEQTRIQHQKNMNGIQIGFERTNASSCVNCFWYQFFWLEIDVTNGKDTSKYNTPIDFRQGHPDASTRGFDTIQPTTEGAEHAHWVVDGSMTSAKYVAQKCDECGTVLIDKPGANFDIESFPLTNGVPRFSSSTADKVVSKLHFESYLVCGTTICGRVKWTSTWTWTKGNTGIDGPEYSDIHVDKPTDFEGGQKTALTNQQLASPLTAPPAVAPAAASPGTPK